MRRIVITGGPGAGKTVISRAIADRFADRAILIPEAATQIYAKWQTRWDLITIPERRQVQREIYQLQREQEDAIAANNPGKSLLLDRGTIDGSCYWPDGPEDYWLDVKSTHPQELARYDAVIWLESGAALGIYDGQDSNTCRFEDAAAAIEAGELLKRVWGKHPKMFLVKARPKLDEKTEEVAKIVGELLR